MTFRQEAASWLFPSSLSAAEAPEIGKLAPSTDKVPIPDPSGTPLIITFLRHCGCPFAEQTFRRLQKTAKAHPSITFIAVSHSSSDSTNKWLASLPTTDQLHNLRVIVDDSRETYGAWGLGSSSFLHILNPTSLYNVYKLGKAEGIWNRPTESGTRWQTSGSWAIDMEGMVRWGGAAKSADDVPDFGEAVKALVGGN